MLYEALPENKVRCNLCARRCVIPDAAFGFCRVRKNESGKLFSLVYGRACAANVDPIEKKPLFHFHPGSAVMSIATTGCNFRCKFCDNWAISQEKEIIGSDLPPERVIGLAKRYRCQGISYTYTEPTIFFEYAYDTAKLAHREGLFNTFVTNGYMTPEAVETIAPYLDAATVDFKGGADPEFYKKVMSVPDVEPIFRCLETMKKHGIHIEITNLVVTKYGESMDRIRQIAAWVRDNLGPDTAFHIIRFHPAYDLVDVPSTPTKTLEEAHKVAVAEGLHYVYLGNVPGHSGENTYCPNCNELLVERFGFDITRWNLKPDNTCPKCGEKAAIVGRYKSRGRWHLSIV